MRELGLAPGDCTRGELRIFVGHVGRQRSNGHAIF